MYRLASESKYNSSQQLKAAPGYRLNAMRNSIQGRREPERRLQEYQREVKQLKIRCGKIDQIEKYVNILVQQNKNYKKTNGELQRMNGDLKKEINALQEQNIFIKNRKHFREGALLKEMQVSRAMENNRFEDNFRQIRLQQELINEKQKYEKSVSTLDSKYRSDLMEIQQFSKNVEMRFVQESKKYGKQIDLLKLQNKELKFRLAQQQQVLMVAKSEDDKKENQLKRYMAIQKQSQNEAIMKENLINKIENDSYKAIQAINIQLQTIREQLKDSQRDHQKAKQEQRRLKNECELLIAEGTEMKEIILQLEEIKYSQMRTIQNLEGEIRQQKDINQYKQNQNLQNQERLRQFIDALQKDNMQLRQMEKEIKLQLTTKQQQIHDLIKIVSTLQESQKIACRSVVQLKEVNAKLSLSLSEKECQIENQAIDMQSFANRCKESQKYAAETEKNYVQVKSKLLQMQLICSQESNKVKQLSRLLQIETEKNQSAEDERQKLIKRSEQREQLLRNSQQCIDQCQKLYAIEKSKIQSSNTKLNQLQQQISRIKCHFEQREKLFFQEKEELKMLLENQKQQFQDEELQKVQSAMMEKYQAILSQKSQQFKSKIQSLKDEIQSLSKSETFNKFD